MGKAATLFVAGLVTVGIITSLTMNGRNTVNLASTGFKGANSLLGTAING